MSFVTPYFSTKFVILPRKHCEPFCVSTPVVESILAERIYRDCPIYINHKNTMADLVELYILDFDFILGMYCFMPVMHQWIVELELSSFKFLLSQS